MSEVYSIKELKDINKIKSYLKKKSDRDYTLFVLGINIGLRASDLLSLKVKDIFTNNGKVIKELTVIEDKTEKKRDLFINDSAKNCLEDFYKVANFNSEDDYLFKSRKGKNEAIEVRSVNRLVKEWCKECRIKGNYGTHSLRKTFGYHLYNNNSNNPFILPYLMRIFNHSSQSVTLRYIGIEQEDINTLYSELNL